MNNNNMLANLKTLGKKDCLEKKAMDNRKQNKIIKEAKDLVKEVYGHLE